MMQADNPGLWFFHCHLVWHPLIGQGHLVWHQLIGQRLVLAEGFDQIENSPSMLPQCSQQCNSEDAPFDPA